MRAVAFRRRGRPAITETGRECGLCGQHFSITWPDSNRRYCSAGCAKKAIQIARRAFHKRNPRKQIEYNAKRPYKDSKLERLCRKYPAIPKSCQSCGESRVVEIAHRPEFRHVGGVIGSNIENRAPHMIWVLCPTCHKLLDKGICTPSELGLA